MPEEKRLLPQWLMPLAHRNEFIFNASPRDFTVEEVPLYPWSGEGEHLIVTVRKKGLTTWEMISILSSYLGIRSRDIGYAGLKDKHALTTQSVSLPITCETQLAQFAHEKITIVDTNRHSNKIRIGHLKGNRFRLRLKKVLGVQQQMLDSVLDWIEANGAPNYFGHQRFGTQGDNWQLGKRLAEGKTKMRNRKNAQFLIGAYQSYLFNGWLSKRIEMSRLLEEFGEEEAASIMGLDQGMLQGTKSQPNFFKIVSGDLLMHYPYGRIFTAEDLSVEAARFRARDVAPTGPISGKKCAEPSQAAWHIESSFHAKINESGTRRYAWIFPEEITRRYVPEKAHYELGFFLPKGSYATNVVDLLRGKRNKDMVP